VGGQHTTTSRPAGRGNLNIKMLKELCIRDFKLLRDAGLTFGRGLNVLTGETGAGKTQCLEALKAAVGARLGDDAISKDSEKAIVTAEFDLSDRPDVLSVLRNEGWLDDDETEVIVERTIERNGPSRGRLNGRRVPIGTLQSVGNMLVDLLGQNARADILTRPALEILDSLGDDKHRSIVDEVRELYAEWRGAQKEYNRVLKEIESARERRELVEFQHDELHKAELRQGEEEELTRESELLENARERIESAMRAGVMLSGSEDETQTARDILQEALDETEKLAGIDAELKPDAMRLKETVFFIDELADTLRRYGEDVVDDPERRAIVEERLLLIHRLKRKYKLDEAGLIELRDRLAAELEIVDSAEGNLKKLKGTVESCRKRYLESAVKLSGARKSLGKRISKEVKGHLADLDLPHAKFSAEIETDTENEDAWRPDGVDRAELMIATNPAQNPAPLKKVASGGELSRLLIAIKTVLANRDRVPVLVFDEAEAGIGGETGFRVAEKLTELAGSHQLIIVSHLPQIASQAVGHWVIEKSREAKGASAVARMVDGEDRVNEIGRMLGDRGDRRALVDLARSFLEHSEMKS